MGEEREYNFAVQQLATLPMSADFSLILAVGSQHNQLAIHSSSRMVGKWVSGETWGK